MEDEQNPHPTTTLREAARVLRQRASAAPRGRYSTSKSSKSSYNITAGDGDIIATTTGWIAGEDDNTGSAKQCAEHFGLWNPVVALACARWLEACADNWPPQLIVTATPTASAERRAALETARELLKAAA